MGYLISSPIRERWSTYLKSISKEFYDMVSRLSIGLFALYSTM